MRALRKASYTSALRRREPPRMAMRRMLGLGRAILCLRLLVLVLGMLERCLLTEVVCWGVGGFVFFSAFRKKARHAETGRRSFRKNRGYKKRHAKDRHTPVEKNPKPSKLDFLDGQSRKPQEAHHAQIEGGS